MQDLKPNRENNDTNGPHLTELVPCRTCAAVRRMAGMALFVVMSVIFVGAWSVPDVMRAYAPILSGVGFNTAITLMLAALALLLPRQRLWLGGLVAAISAVVMVQYFLAWMPPDGFWRIALNVDGRGLPWPGRMAPLSAFSLLCAGLALTVLDRTPRLSVQILLQLVPGLILMAAVGGVINRYLDGLLFVATLDRYAVMSLPSLTALSILVAGYLAALLEAPWFRHFYQRREDRQVLVIGLAGFFVAILLGGAASIAVLGRQMQETVAEDLSRTVQAQAAALPLLVSPALQNLHARADSELSRDDLPALLRELAGPEGAAWLEQRDGTVTLSAGRPRVTSQFRLRLKDALPAWLIREQGWRLEMHFPAARGQGTLVVQEPLHLLDSLFYSSQADASRGVETRLCQRSGQQGMACFPSLFMPRSLLLPLRRNDQPVPMWYALEGRRGATVASDYRGVLVVAAYTPLVELGLGMVRKIDAEKMYQPIRTVVWQAFGVMVGIGMLAVLLIYLRVRRVVRQATETGRQLRGVLDVLPVGVWFADAEGRLTMNNPAASRIWQGERWVGVDELSVYKGWWHDSGKRIEAHEWALARAFRQGETSIDEVVDIECFDGSRKIISNSALPLYDEQGVFAGAVGVDKDVTGPVLAEEELSASRDLLRAIVENTPARVFWKDVELRYLGCNAAFAHDAGMWSPEELIGKDDFQMGWHEQAERYRADDRRVMDSHTPIIDYEEQQTTPDGRMIWLRTSKVPLLDANGKVIGVLGIYDDITAYKQMMEELRREKDKLDEAQHVGGMGSWELDLVENVLYWSDEMYRIFEIDPERFGASYEAFLDALHPDDRERVNQVYTQSLKTREPYEVEHRLLFPDGRIKHVVERCETFRDAGGLLLRSAGTTQDITGRMNVEAEIRRLESEFRSLAENLPDIVSRFDRELRHVYINPEVEKSTGLSREFLLGKTHAELDMPDMASEIWTNALRRVIFTGEPEMFEFRAATSGGVVKYYHTRAVPEFDASGKVESVLTIARDISTLKGAEAVLRESEERLHGITSNVPGMVFQSYRQAEDGKLQFTYISNGAKWLLGLDAAAILRDGSAFVGFINPDDRLTFHTSMVQSQEELSFWNWEGRIVTEDGEARWINLRATPRRHSENVCMWDGVAINITESKTSEEKLVNSQNMLRELSAHLENVREEERKRIAREIHDELGQTLTALRMDVSLARLGFGETNPLLMARLQSMTQLVDRTIKTARHVTSSLRPGALDLGIVAALEWLVEEFIGYAGIPCELVLGDGDIVLSELTATAVFRIVQESLTNIARHAEATQIEIIVTRFDDQLCFEVRDNGKGFDPHMVASRKSFGLVGIRERVAMMDGVFEIDSEPGQGTRIRACIPAV